MHPTKTRIILHNLIRVFVGHSGYPRIPGLYIWTVKSLIRLCKYIGWSGGGWVRQRCRVSCVTGASNCDWLTVGQGLLFLQQVRVEGEYFYFFCFLSFINFPLSPLSLSFISSTISSVSLLPFSGRWHKITHRVEVSLTPTQSIKIGWSESCWMNMSWAIWLLCVIWWFFMALFCRRKEKKSSRKKTTIHLFTSGQPSRPQWLSQMCIQLMTRRSGVWSPPGSGKISLWRLIMKYFLWSFSPFRWFKKAVVSFWWKNVHRCWLMAQRTKPVQEKCG